MPTPTLSLFRPLLLAALLLPTLALAQGLRFTTLDIGQGDSAVLIAPGGCVALFDGGPTGSGADIKAYLKQLGVTRVQMAFVSHMHADHMGGIDEVEKGTNAIPIDKVYDHGGTYDSTAFTEYNTQFSGRRQTVQAGNVFMLCNEVRLEVVASNGNGLATDDENTKSVVVKISYGAFDALVGGDLTGTPDDMESLIASKVGEVELYKVHHHGSRYSSTSTFLNATKPLVSFISVGKGNIYGHPTLECLERLAMVNSDVWQTEDPAGDVALGHIELSSATGSTFVVKQGSNSVTYTSKSADGTPPTAPGSLVASAVSSSEVDLTWNAATDNVGVTGYRVYRSTGGSYSLAGTTTTTGFADLGLAASTAYSYQVTAVDAAGNESAAATASATTQAATRGVTVTSPNGGESWTVGTSRSITWTSFGLTSLRLEYTLDNGATWTVINANVAASGGVYTWTVPNSPSTAARVRISDAMGTLTRDTSDGTFTLASISPAKVILNEILANEPGSSTAEEFIELVNVGGQAIAIGGWTVSDATGVRHTFAAGTTLAAGKSLVVFGGAAGLPPGMSNGVAASTGTLSLNNAGDTVVVKNGATKQATVVDSFTYSGSLAGVDGVSMNRNPDASTSGTFVLHTSLSLLSASPGTRANGGNF
jgi:beta-lactamase superfamily II metal-dependent hydrolase/fibronectin type 3 domain-containing protein